MDADELKARTKQFTLRILRLTRSLPANSESRAIRSQLARCGTSVGANYRAVCRSRSRAEFIAKIGVVEEEADECCFWLEIIVESGMLTPAKVRPLLQEANDLTAYLLQIPPISKKQSPIR